jgi:ribonuclease HI
VSDATVLKIHTDGAARGNPGEAAFAYVIARDGQAPIEVAGLLGRTTNNQAEYTALVRALEHALRLGRDNRLVVHSDSELMVKQLNGEYRVKNAELRPLYDDACALRKEFTQPVRIVHVRREQNSRADELCNEVLDGVREPTELDEEVAETAPAPAPGRHATSDEKAVLLLTTAAKAWAGSGSPEMPAPEDVWRQLKRILAGAD